MDISEFTDAMESLTTRLKQIARMGLRELLSKVADVVDDMKNVAGMIAPDIASNEAARVLDILANALDQVIARGSDDLAQVTADYVEEIGAAALDASDYLGVTLADIGEIINNAQATAIANNYGYIRQIITPLRNEIIQTFADAMRYGHGPNWIEDQLRNIGLPWSPTGRYSPGERAAMIAYTEYWRIQERIKDDIRRKAGVGYCYNQLNLTLKTHSKICIAAPRAGLIKVEEMKKKYMLPPRHPRCGCTLVYVKPEWGLHNQAINDQIDFLTGNGYNVDKIYDDWQTQGPQQVDRRNAWRANLQWENKIIDRLFGR